MIYADYTYYNSIHHGTMSSEEYAKLSRQASVYIDSLTRGKAEAVTEQSTMTKLKDTCCMIADVLLISERDVSSESNDGISVTYASSGKSVDRKIQQIALRYLSGTGLISRWC